MRTHHFAKHEVPKQDLYRFFNRTGRKILSEKGTLPAKYRPHKLKGKYKGLYECHIQDDWLLVWKKIKDKMVLIMTNTGTHAELFKK